MNSSTIASCTLAIWLVVASSAASASRGPLISPVPAPGPAADCSTLVYDMVDCMSFLSGDESTPSKSCCSGLRTVINANVECICFGLEMSESLGIPVNMTRAEEMPADCRVSAPPISMCNVSAAPASSPAASPGILPPTTSSSPSPTPSAPAPSKSPSPSAPSPTPSNSPIPAPTSPPSISPSPASDTPSPTNSPSSQPPAADTPAPAPEGALTPPSDEPKSDSNRAFSGSTQFSILLLIASAFI